MLVLVRVDERLLHGQVALSWKSALSYEALLIANDEVAKDDLRKSALKLATPVDVRLAIRSIKEAAELTSHEKLVGMKTFVILNSPRDAKIFYENIKERPKLNLGNMGKKEGKKMCAKSLYLGEEDFKSLEELFAMGIDISAQEVPNSTAISYQELKKNFT